MANPNRTRSAAVLSKKNEHDAAAPDVLSEVLAAKDMERLEARDNWAMVEDLLRKAAALCARVAGELDKTGKMDDEAAGHAVTLVESAASFSDLLRGKGGYRIDADEAALQYAKRTLAKS